MAALADRLEEARRSHKLNLGYAELEEFPVACLDDIKKQNIRIRELELASNRLTTLPAQLHELRHVTTLRLKYNQLTSLPRVLLELKYLTVLELSGNQITVIDDFVKDFAAVKELDLSGNRISSLPEALCQMPRLEVLSVEHNRIAELPASIGSLHTLVKINLSTNVLRTLPESIAGLKKLQRINCANNLLATVPSEIGFLKTLKEFNLRSNNLDTVYKAKVDEGLSRFLAFLREEHQRQRLEEIERQRPIGTQIGSYLEYRCKADPKKVEKDATGITCTDNRCWIRTGHSLNHVGTKLYIVGGTVTKDAADSNDLFWISTDRMEWTKDSKVAGDKPSIRHGHCCVYDPEHNRLVLFGGKAENRKRTNDVYTLGLNSIAWTKINASGTQPPPRECASAVYWAEQMIVYGGMSSGSRLNDLCFLDLSSMTWSQPPISGTAPSPRQFAAICVVNSSQLLLHGGQNHFVLDDLYVFDIMSKTWSTLSAKGQVPPPRHSHQLHFFEGAVYLFGGYDDLGAAVHSLHKLSIDSDRSLSQQDLVWTELESELEPNSSRIAILHENKLEVFQVGSRSLGFASSDNIEKGLVFWDVFKSVSLTDLREKQLDAEALKPKNPKLCRVHHTLTILNRMPRAYTTQMPREKKSLHYAKAFQGTFFSLYRHRRPLLLAPMNECGVEKFVCSFVRPTKLHYTELYDLKSVSQFVSDFVQYEPLENPLHPPKYWSSPTSTLKWQAGDSFDLAILLTSLLIGAGYDAYACVGYAPEHVILNDRTLERYGFQDWEGILDSFRQRPIMEHPEEESVIDPEGRYCPRLPTTKLSADRELTVDDEQSPGDDIKGDAACAVDQELVQSSKSKFIHAWVMIAPTSREVTERLFVEPSTSTIYQVDSSPYEGIELVFNHENYWMCMQLTTPDSDARARPEGINFDLTDGSLWEPVFGTAKIESTKRETGTKATCSRGEVGPPSSWVSRLTISQDVFNMRCPRGYKAITYRNCVHEKFALFGECARWDGLVDRLSYFLDTERKQPCMIDHYYQRRKDKLERKCTRIEDQRIVDVYEAFGPGHPYALRMIHRTVGERHLLELYPDSRLDGMVSREENLGVKTIERFANRSDRLIYRSIAYKTALPESEAASDEVVSARRSEILKLTEKFERDESIPFNDDVAKRVFYLSENKIRVDFHYGDGKITHDSRIFHKEGHSHADPSAPKLTPEFLHEEFHRLLTAEKKCIQAAKDTAKEMKEILTDCQNQDLQVKLVTPYYDSARDQVSLSNEDEKESASDTDGDYLKAFFPAVATDTSLSKEQALSVREKCLRALKERLIERANIMQERHDDETAALDKLTANYNRDKDQMTVEQVHEYEQSCADTKFRISILDKRLKRHEEQALQRYVTLDRKLRKDPRLKAMLDQS